jgi:hypothetical protein
VNGENGTAEGAEREGVLIVADPRSYLAQQPRQLPRHAELLGARRKLDRFDPLRHEIWMARHCREAQVGRGRGQPAKQVLDVGLVAGPLPTEDVSVDEDVDAHSFTC